MKHKPAVITLALTILITCSSTAIGDVSKRQIIVRSIDSVFKPAADSLVGSAKTMLSAVNDVCHTDTAEQAFSALIASFSEIEFNLIGAINQDNRAERLFFWPDPKSKGRKQILRMLDNPARSTLDAIALSKKSVALQGLPALEQILFGNPPNSPLKDCAYAVAIATNIQTMAAEIQEDWYSEEGVVKALLESNPDLIYHDEDEAIGAIVTQAAKSIHAINGLKVARIIDGLEKKGSIPKGMPFWNSNLTLQNLHGNVIALRRLILDNGMAEYANTEDKLAADFKAAELMVAETGKALKRSDTVTAIEHLKQLRQLLIDVNIVISVTIAPALGVIPGFNGRDGD